MTAPTPNPTPSAQDGAREHLREALTTRLQELLGHIAHWIKPNSDAVAEAILAGPLATFIANHEAALAPAAKPGSGGRQKIATHVEDVRDPDLHDAPWMELRAALVKALDGHTAWSRDCSLSGEYLTGLIWPLVRDALPAALRHPAPDRVRAAEEAMRERALDAVVAAIRTLPLTGDQP